MTKIFVFVTSIFVCSIVHAAADIKYASSQEIESMQQKAASSLTPLIEAIIERDIPKIEKLLKKEGQVSGPIGSWLPWNIIGQWWGKDNVQINAKDNAGQTALMWAIIHDLPVAVIKLLLSVQNIDVTITDNQGLTALDHAVMNGKDEIVKALLNACKLKDGICPLVNQRDTKLQLTPLARAAMADNSQIINLLLRAGANPTAIVTRGDKTMPVSNLYKKFTDRSLEVIDALKDEEIEKAKKLIMQGIDVHAKNQYGETILHWAAIRGDKDIVKLLIDSKADVNAKDLRGTTPLHLAADHGHKDIIKLLIDNKAVVNSKNYDGDTPVDFAVLNDDKDVIEMLKKARAK